MDVEVTLTYRGEGSVPMALMAASGTQYEALAEARERAVSRSFVPTGKIVIRKVTQKRVRKPAASKRQKG